MKKYSLSLIALVIIIPQMTLAMTVDGHFPFLHPSKTKPSIINTSDTGSNTPVNEPAHKKLATNTNSEATLFDILQTRLHNVIATQLQRVRTLKATIETREKVPTFMKSTVLKDLTEDETFFTDQLTGVDNAETVAELKVVDAALHQHLLERKERLQAHATDFTNRAKEASSTAHRVGTQVVEKLEHISSGLEEHSIDTAELNAQITMLKQDVEKLKNNDTAEGSDALRSATTTIRTEIQTIIATIKSLVK